jgi:hypothetical protein
MLHVSSVKSGTLGLLKSLNYFTDAEEDEDLVLFKKADWNTVKKTIEAEVKKMYAQ